MFDNPNPKFPPTERPRWSPNEDINKIAGLIDFIVDDFGNYYTPYKTKHNGSKLTEITLVHVFYNESFSTIFGAEENETTYRFSHLGELLLDRINGHIKELEIESRKIFSVDELLENGTKVYFWDITHYKTQNKKK